MADNYDEIKDALQKLQEKIEKLEKENKDLKGEKEENLKESTVNPMEKYDEELTRLETEISELMNKICDETEFKMIAMCISKVRLNSRFGGTDVSLSYSKSFDGICAEGIAAAAEVFTNPRRIEILKVLAFDDLTASEIAQKTGLIGGQLYHHLANLENAGLISKENEKYKASQGTYGLLASLLAVLGRMNIAKR